MTKLFGWWACTAAGVGLIRRSVQIPTLEQHLLSGRRSAASVSDCFHGQLLQRVCDGVISMIMRHYLVKLDVSIGTEIIIIFKDFMFNLCLNGLLALIIFDFLLSVLKKLINGYNNESEIN